jgi:hypothetical protein
MAKLLKSDENTWKVLDDAAVLTTDGVTDINGKLVNERRPTNDDETPVLGEVYLKEGDVMFIPETWRGTEHTANHLREIADLMDGLGKSSDGRRTYIEDAVAGK